MLYKIGIKYSDDYPFERTPPIFGTPGSACFDVASIEHVVVFPGQSATVRTGLHFVLPRSTCLKMYSRSGQGKKNVRMSNCVGIFDSDYTGEAHVMITNDGVEPYVISPGDRIAQAMLVETHPIYWEELHELPATTRGSNGFGSTGV